VLDADQVRKIVAGEPLEPAKPATTPVAAAEDPSRKPAKDRPVVAGIPPLNKPLTQE